MWWIRHTEVGYYANVVKYWVKISIQPTVHKSLNSTNIFASYCLEHIFGGTDTSCISQFLKMVWQVRHKSLIVYKEEA